MVRVSKNKNARNKHSFASMHYDSPVTRSQTAVLDLFKRFPDGSSMFRDPGVRGVLEEELVKNPGRIMTRHMVKYRPISEIEDLGKMAKRRKIKGKRTTNCSAALASARVKGTRQLRSRTRKQPGSVRAVRRLSGSSRGYKNNGGKRKRKSVNQFRVTINSTKSPNLPQRDFASMTEENRHLQYETHPVNNCAEFYHSESNIDKSKQLNDFELGYQNHIFAPCRIENNSSSRKDMTYGRGQYPSLTLDYNTRQRQDVNHGIEHNQFYQSQSPGGNARLLNNTRFDTRQNDNFASQILENDIYTRNNMGRDRHHKQVRQSSRRFEDGTYLRNDQRYGKEVIAPTYGMGTQQFERGREYQSVNAVGKLIRDMDIKEERSSTQNTKKAHNKCEKPKSISLWFGNAVSSVSSYVTKYIPF